MRFLLTLTLRLSALDSSRGIGHTVDMFLLELVPSHGAALNGVGTEMQWTPPVRGLAVALGNYSWIALGLQIAGSWLVPFVYQCKCSAESKR